MSILSVETRRDKAACSGSRQQVATSLTFASNAAHSKHPASSPAAGAEPPLYPRPGSQNKHTVLLLQS